MVVVDEDGEEFLQLDERRDDEYEAEVLQPHVGVVLDCQAFGLREGVYPLHLGDSLEID